MFYLPFIPLPDEPKEHVDRLVAYAKTKSIDDIAFQVARIDQDPSLFKTVCHGDLWANNIMVILDDADNTKAPKDVKFLDYQAMATCHPVKYALSH